LAAVSLFVTGGDLAVLEGQEAVVGEGHGVDRRGEIFQGVLPVSGLFTMNHPVFVPGWRGNLIEEAGFFQQVAELGAEEEGESFHRDEESFTGRQPLAVVWGEAPAGNDLMDVGGN
jgi:hypothetical protein